MQVMDHNNHFHQDSAKPRYALRDFLPLITVFVIIFIFTAIASRGQSVMDTMRNFMGVFFLTFGAFKIIRWKGFVDAYQIYDLIAQRSRFYAYLYPLIVLALGAAFIFSFNIYLACWATLAIMLISATGVAN